MIFATSVVESATFCSNSIFGFGHSGKPTLSFVLFSFVNVPRRKIRHERKLLGSLHSTFIISSIIPS